MSLPEPEPKSKHDNLRSAVPPNAASTLQTNCSSVGVGTQRRHEGPGGPDSASPRAEAAAHSSSQSRNTWASGHGLRAEEKLATSDQQLGVVAARPAAKSLKRTSPSGGLPSGHPPAQHETSMAKGDSRGGRLKASSWRSGHAMWHTGPFRRSSAKRSALRTSSKGTPEDAHFARWSAMSSVEMWGLEVPSSTPKVAIAHNADYPVSMNS